MLLCRMRENSVQWSSRAGVKVKLKLDVACSRGEAVWWGARRRRVCPWNARKCHPEPSPGEVETCVLGGETAVGISPTWTYLVLRWPMKTNLEVVSAQKAAAWIGKEDLLERKREIKTLLLQRFSEVLYAVLNPLGLFPDSNGKYKGKTLLGQANLWVVPRSQRP